MSPTSYQTAPPRDWRPKFTTDARSKPRLGQGLEEARGVLEAHEPGGDDLLAAGIEEDRAGRAEQAETPQELTIVVVVRGDVGLQQQRAGELLLHLRVGEGVALHLLAGHAPVGVEIE